tara:strand:+ start:249 stop:878 length:630 start_codon:yes stop_codon:yes gene_type:complete
MKRRIISILLLTFSFFFFNINVGIAPLGSKTTPNQVTPNTINKITLNGTTTLPLQIGLLDIPAVHKMKLREKDVKCLAKNIFFEAAVESTAGKVAVAYVTLNRVESNKYPNTICDVVYQGSHFSNGHPKRDMCQFSWYCDGKGDIPRPGPLWNESQRVAKEMIRRHISAQLLDITDGSTHYHANWMVSFPRWSEKRKKMVSIDQHIFYR